MLNGISVVSHSHKSRSLKVYAITAASLLSYSTRAAAWSSALLESANPVRFSLISQASSSPPTQSVLHRQSTLYMSSTPTSCPEKTFSVAQFKCLSDNYGYLIHDERTKQTAAIDTPCATTYQSELEKRGWKLTHIFNTHHHWDHTGGNMELKKDGVKVYGPINEKAKIPGLDIAVGSGDEIQFGSSVGKVMDVGGHTHGHIAYYFPQEESAFVGDSLFALGCGRMFEGTPIQFWTSLKSLRELPDETFVYCAHEYTESNAKFALGVEPGNSELVARAAQVKAKRANGEATVPSKMGEEKRTNPFLRVDVSDEIRRNVGVTEGDTEADAFAKVRRAKDAF